MRMEDLPLDTRNRPRHTMTAKEITSASDQARWTGRTRAPARTTAMDCRLLNPHTTLQSTRRILLEKQVKDLPQPMAANLT